MCEYKNIFRCEECPHYCDDCDGDEDNMGLTLNELVDMQAKILGSDIISISAEGVHMTSEKFFSKFNEFSVKKGKKLNWVSQIYKGVKFFALANDEEIERELKF